MKVQILGIILFLNIGSSFSKNYDGYKVFATDTVDSIETLRKIITLVESDETNGYDFWRTPTLDTMSASIIVKPGSEKNLKNVLDSFGVAYNETIPNIQKIFDIEKQNNKLASSHLFSFNAYYGYDQLNGFMKLMAQKYRKFVRAVIIGKSFEGRDMRILKIEKAGPDAPVMFLEAGIHAREWIGPAATSYLIYALLERPENAHLLNHINFHILPLANPDGYEYSRIFDRLWRKTRSYYSTSGSACIGVDANRNWDYKWGTSGISFGKCSNVYPGSKPFSEIETRNIRDYLKSLPKLPYLALSIHSAASLLLYPYGYREATFPGDVNDLRNLGSKFISKLNNVHGQNFRLQNAAELYPASGITCDYYKGVLGIKYAYVVELRRSQSFNIFDLRPEEIIPSGQELFEGLKEFIIAGYQE